MRQRHSGMAATSTAAPRLNPVGDGRGDDEPLLGRPGDASLPDGKGLHHNLYLGTAILAQAGTWILAGVVWASVFTHPLILFSAHPLLNSAGLLLITQGTLVLQPTHTPTQKRQGAHVHAAFNTAGVAALLAGLVVIEYNKFSHHGAHFKSVHATLGLVTSALLMLQALVGLTQFYTPALYGGENNAKKVYKYHRMAGYAIVGLMLATVIAATQTDYSRAVLHINLWAVVAGALLVVVGVVPRIKLRKFGFRQSRP